MTIEERLDDLKTEQVRQGEDLKFVKEAVQKHNDRHFQVGLQSTLALVGAGIALIAAWFK